jgi:MraZ protein
MLIGTWGGTLENDGRLVLPPTFRRAAIDGLTITRGFDRCLQVFPAPAWQSLAQRVSALPITADAARALRRMLFGAAAYLGPDASEVLCVPPPLLAYAELATQVVYVGMYTYFEIWSVERWAGGGGLGAVGRGVEPAVWLQSAVTYRPLPAPPPRPSRERGADARPESPLTPTWEWGGWGGEGQPAPL